MSDTNTSIGKKHLNQYTREELLALPTRDWKDESVYDSILLLQSDDLHDSEYRCMIIIGVIDSVPVEIAYSYCDDIEWLTPYPNILAGMYPQGQMRMECLDTSRAFHPWSICSKFKVGCSLSSITIEVIRSE